MTGAKYEVMDADVSVDRVGGHNDFHYGPTKPCGFHPRMSTASSTTATRSLGGTVLTAHLTAGHTRGTTTWTMDETIPAGHCTWSSSAAPTSIRVTSSSTTRLIRKSPPTTATVPGASRHCHAIFSSAPTAAISDSGEVRALQGRRPQRLHRSRRLSQLCRGLQAGLRVRTGETVDALNTHRQSPVKLGL